MGRKKYVEQIEALFEKSPVVDFKSIEKIVREKSEKNNYAKLLVSNMLKKGRIKKVGKGMYTKFDEVSLSVFSFRPAYIGLQSALSYHGLWDQETVPVIITSRKARRGIRKVMGNNILVRNIARKHFFGFDYLKEGNFYLPYSDIEKTLIDIVAFNQKIDKQVLNNIRKKIDGKKLEKYLMKYPRNIKNRVLKMISEGAIVIKK